VYLPPNKGIPLTDYWDKFRDAHHQSILITGYPTEKNFDMMKMIVSASSNPGDLVIDPFNGSGSTIHAAELLGRKWIGIDQSLVAIRTTVARLSNGRKPMGDFVKRDAAPDLFADIETVTRHEESAQNFDLFVDAEIADVYESEVLDLAKMMGYD
jgi:adenine-specific DNA-methyltransferase